LKKYERHRYTQEHKRLDPVDNPGIISYLPHSPEAREILAKKEWKARQKVYKWSILKANSDLRQVIRDRLNELNINSDMVLADLRWPSPKGFNHWLYAGVENPPAGVRTVKKSTEHQQLFSHLTDRLILEFAAAIGIEIRLQIIPKPFPIQK